MHLQGDRPSSKGFSLFESPGGGHLTDTILATLERNDRLVQLWKDLLADSVAPDPAARQGRTGGSHYGMNEEATLLLGPDRARPSLLSLETALESPGLQDAEWTEPVPFTGTVKTGLASRGWMVDLATWFHSLAEVEDAGPADPSEEEAVSEDEAHSLSSPFRWEPKPAWINAPVQSDPPFTNMADPRRFAARPKIPIRPLHKQPFYMRILFYLRRWLRKSP